MKKILSIITALFLVISINSCKDDEDCYECTLKCGSCIKNGQTIAGCEGDPALQGFSIEAWKAGLEANGYTCTYNNDVEEVCGEENKASKEEDHYDCLLK